MKPLLIDCNEQTGKRAAIRRDESGHLTTQHGASEGAGPTRYRQSPNDRPPYSWVVLLSAGAPHNICSLAAKQVPIYHRLCVSVCTGAERAWTQTSDCHKRRKDMARIHRIIVSRPASSRERGCKQALGTAACTNHSRIGCSCYWPYRGN